MAAAVVSLQPAEATLLAVWGDPFAFRLRVLDDAGDPVDVSLWEWSAAVRISRERVPFEAAPDDQGVTLFMRGDETMRLPVGKARPFDVACRQPSAGEGTTVLAGQMTAAARVTLPLRSDPELVPA